MFAWLKKLLYDEAAFEQYARVLLFALGEIAVNAAPSSTVWYFGQAIKAMALFPSKMSGNGGTR